MFYSDLAVIGCLRFLVLRNLQKGIEKMAKTITKTFKDHEIDAQIKAVGKLAISLQQKIHNLAVSTLLVWHDTGKGIKNADKVAEDKRHSDDDLLTPIQERQILDILNGNMVEVEVEETK